MAALDSIGAWVGWYRREGELRWRLAVTAPSEWECRSRLAAYANATGDRRRETFVRRREAGDPNDDRGR